LTPRIYHDLLWYAVHVSVVAEDLAGGVVVLAVLELGLTELEVDFSALEELFGVLEEDFAVVEEDLAALEVVLAELVVFFAYEVVLAAELVFAAEEVLAEELDAGLFQITCHHGLWSGFSGVGVGFAAVEVV